MVWFSIIQANHEENVFRHCLHMDAFNNLFVNGSYFVEIFKEFIFPILPSSIVSIFNIFNEICFAIPYQVVAFNVLSIISTIFAFILLIIASGMLEVIKYFNKFAKAFRREDEVKVKFSIVVHLNSRSISALSFTTISPLHPFIHYIFIHYSSQSLKIPES